MNRFRMILLLAVLSICVSLHSQDIKDKLTLSSFNVELDGKTLTVDSVITTLLFRDVAKDILIYKNDELSYWATFKYKFKGRRAKLVRRTYVKLSDGSKIFSKQKKDMQELKVSVPGLFKGKSAESILYDKIAMRSIFVSFNFSYAYMN